MKNNFWLVLGCLSLVVVGCGKQDDSQIVSQKYVHKYGYAVSKNEFEERHYPGQAITVLKNGVTLTSTYENGVLHGPSTQTYPNSQTVAFYYLYNNGALVKEIAYDISGMPISEEVQLSPTRRSITLWYVEGTPRSIEEYAGDELLEGKYFTKAHDLESQVIKGEGRKTHRDSRGALVYLADFQRGLLVKKQSFYENGFPQTIEHYSDGQLDGQQEMFSPKGEPLSVVSYINGKKDGLATLFQNGIKTIEVSYTDDVKNGTERHFIDGQILSKELMWSNGKLHGPATYYIDEAEKVEYHYNGELVSKSRWEEFNGLDELIAQMIETPN